MVEVETPQSSSGLVRVGYTRSIAVPQTDNTCNAMAVAILGVIQADTDRYAKITTKYQQKVNEARKTFMAASRTVLESKIRVDLLRRMASMLGTTNNAAESATSKATSCFGVTVANSALESRWQEMKDDLELASRTSELAISEKDKAVKYLARVEQELAEYKQKWLNNRKKQLELIRTDQMEELFKEYGKPFQKLQQTIEAAEAANDSRAHSNGK